MLIRLWILKIIIDGALCEPTGDHICEVEESYPVNVTEYSWRNATVRNYKWCMGFPPRCSFYTLKRVRVPNIVERNETRIVKKCCTGYAENSKHDGCVQCKKCYYGICGEDGECICNAGFKGEQCGEACEATRWGINCQFQCLCVKGNCDPRTGRCDCPSGRFGTRCELLCLEGFYGKHCMHRCNCGERELCSSQTGECATRSSPRQEHQSTRAIHYLTDDILNFTRMIDKHKSTPSLKKYHTFDMEFNTDKPFHPKLTTVQLINVNEKWKPNSSNKTYSNISKFKDTNTKTSKQLTTIEKNDYELNRKISKTKTKDDYIDSTTETSAEIERSIEHLPMLNEDESLERKDSIELTKKIHKQQNKDDSSKIMNGVIQLATKESSSSVTSRNEENTSKNTHSIGKKYKEKENPQNQNQNWIKLGKTTVPNSEVNKIDSLKVKNQTEIETEEKTFPRLELEENEKKHSASDNKNSVQKSVTNTYGPRIFINESSTKISLQPENNDQKKSSEPVITTIIPENPGKYNFGLKGTATMSNNDVVINVSPTIESTSPLYNSKEQYRGHGNRNDEEDKLQNLDTMLILTSRSTSTSVSIDQESTASKRNNVQLFSAENPATTSTPTMNFIENSLYMTPSIEIRTPLEDIPDFRQKTEEDNYLSDEISGEFNYSSTDNGSLVTHVSIAVFTTLILVMIMTLMVLVHHYTRRRRKQTSKIRSEHHQNYSGGPTVSVYTHSIFHTPLPEPPTFENPIFASPTDNSLDHRTFQTHLVCSLNFPGHHSLEEKEYIYDHPPSTGSYRAASIPEPPDSNEAITAEPLYDEIPSNNKENDKTIQQPNKSSCIYANTCGRTKF